MALFSGPFAHTVSKPKWWPVLNLVPWPNVIVPGPLVRGGNATFQPIGYRR